MNPAKVRKDFPILQQKVHGYPLIYLDSAATSQKPHVVIEAMNHFLRENYGTVHRALYHLSARATYEYGKVREKVQKFLNAQKQEEIIFTRGTTESINTVASSFGKTFLQEGDEVLITEMEHHANIVPWQMACEEKGARLVACPVTDTGELDLEKFHSHLTPRIKLVAIAHISNTLGTINPIKEIITPAHNKGAKVLIDAAQSAPHLPLDVQDLNCDFLVFSPHKACGPTGVGILYGKAELLEKMPPTQGGGDMIETVTFEKTTYNTIPLKFEAGTPMITEVIGLGAALDYLEALGLENIYKVEKTLHLYMEAKLKSIPGLRILGTAKEKGALTTFVIEGAHPFDVGSLLDLKGIAVRTGHHCAQPTMRRFGVEASLRASLTFYNTPEEIDFFITSLQETVSKLRRT